VKKRHWELVWPEENEETDCRLQEVEGNCIMKNLVTSAGEYK
jgi:hypothetical protein